MARFPLAAVFAVCALAQPPQESDQPFTMYATTDLVVLGVTVHDSHGGNIKGLKADDFKIYEDGRPQPIKQFSDEDRPVTIGIVVDASGSMRSKQNDVVAAALTFVGASNPEDEIFAVSFNDRARLGLPADIPFTHDASQLRTALFGMKPQGKTALYDALTLALEHIRKGKWERKAVLLISDGGDNNSTHPLPEVLTAIQESGVAVYTVGLFDEDDPDRNPGVLRQLAKTSGGEAFLPMSLDQIHSLCLHIAADIRASYTLAYTPPQPDQHTTVRKLKVIAKNPAGKAFVRTRASYILSAPQ